MAVLVGSTTGSTSDNFVAGDIVVAKFAAVASGTADQMSVLLAAGSTFTSMILCIYSEVAANPSVPLGQTASITNTAAGVQSANLTAGVSITSGTNYWVGALVLGGTMQTSDGAGEYVGRAGQASLPNPFGVSDFSFGLSVPISAQSTGGGGASNLAPLQLLGPSYAAQRAASI